VVAASVVEDVPHLAHRHTERPVVGGVAEVQVPAGVVAVCISVGVVVAHRLHFVLLAGATDVGSIHDSGNLDLVELGALVRESVCRPTFAHIVFLFLSLLFLQR